MSHAALSGAQFFHVAPTFYRSKIEKMGLRRGDDMTGIWGYTTEAAAKENAGPRADIWKVSAHPEHVIPGHLGSAEWNEDDPVAVIPRKRIPRGHVRRLV